MNYISFMRLQYNSPIVLSFALICAGLMGLTELVGHDFMVQWFSVPARGHFSGGNPLHWFRLFSHVFGHGSWSHLLGNMTFILLLGPMLEEKFKNSLLIMMVLTAGITGILNVLIFPSALMGASGIVFMMILLSSFSNQKSNSIPLTFVLVAMLFLTREFANVFANNRISEFAHILGGVMGSLFGFFKKR